MSGIIKVNFPLNALKQNEGLIDLQDLNTIWEYYIAENLSCGLVRDSLNNSSGYEGCIAKNFFQPNENSWQFDLEKIKWSDGTFVSPSDIEGWIKNIFEKKYRHLGIKKEMKDYTYDSSANSLLIVFNKKVGTEILHELSLADASFVSSDPKSKSWNKTIGPFYVESWDWENGSLILNKNDYFINKNSNFPSRVIIANKKFELFEQSDFLAEFDLFPISIFFKKDSLEKIRKNGSKLFISNPVASCYFSFNRLNISSERQSTRNQFHEAIQQFKSSFDIQKHSEKNFSNEEQVIPEGFQGRINHYKIDLNKSSSNTEESLKIKIQVHPYFKEIIDFEKKLKSSLLDNGFEVEIIFMKNPHVIADHDVFAAMNSFLGNQMDVSGSWEFLLGSEKSPLGQWRYLVQKEYDEAFKATGKIEREKAFQTLHKKVLDENIAIPLFVGSQKYYVSDRIDVSAWSKLDARMRFYQIKMK